MSARPLLVGLVAGACHGVALLDRGSGGSGRTAVGDTGGLAEVFAIILIVAGFVTIAMALRGARGVERARSGFLYGAVFSLVALHWIPAAAGVWFGWVGGFAAGLTVWAFHGVLAAIAFELVGRGAARVGLPLAMVPGWIVLEWLPSAIPLVHLPRPELASVLVDVPGVLAGASVLGGTGVMALVAGIVAGGVVVGERIRRRSDAERLRDPERLRPGPLIPRPGPRTLRTPHTLRPSTVGGPPAAGTACLRPYRRPFCCFSCSSPRPSRNSRPRTRGTRRGTHPFRWWLPNFL